MQLNDAQTVYLDCSTCQKHGEDIIYYCQQSECNGNRLCCAQCKKMHNRHKLNTCKDKLLKISKNLSIKNQFEKQYRNVCALHLRAMYKDICEIKSNTARMNKQMANFDALSIKAYAQGLLFQPEQIYGHIQTSQFDQNKWEQLTKLSEQISSTDFKNIKFVRYNQNKMNKITEIKQQIMQKFSQLQILFIDLFQQAQIKCQQIQSQNQTAKSVFGLSLSRNSMISQQQIHENGIINFQNKQWSNTKLLENIAVISKEQLINAKIFKLANNKLNDRGLQQLIQLNRRSFPKLEQLDLQNNKLTNSSIDQIASLTIPNIRKIKLQGNQINMTNAYKLYDKFGDNIEITANQEYEF